jgi:Co/Zn/Cd efflux system component
VKKSVYKINRMDCPSEERIIRMKLQSIPSIKHLQFDIADRKLIIIHDGDGKLIENSISELHLDSSLLETKETREVPLPKSTKIEKRILILVLLINLTLFLIEITTGFLSKSMGLVADSLDMLADSIVYGLSLYAVGHSIARKKKIAKLAGFFQFFLAILGFLEVIRRFVGFAEMPVFQMMIFISIIALTGNILSLLILQKVKDSGAHMKASWIFTSNDVIVNLGVIIAGILVYYTSSNKPDLIIGSIVFILVARGAYRIYNLSK